MFSSKRQLACTSFALVPVMFIANSSHAQAAPSLDQACSAIATSALPQTRITRAEAVHVTGEYAVPGTAYSPVTCTASARVIRVCGNADVAIAEQAWSRLGAD